MNWSSFYAPVLIKRQGCQRS
ncbi:TPR repeat family protein, partial [Vibrio parahaemolyticus V-223/04]